MQHTFDTNCDKFLKCNNRIFLSFWQQVLKLRYTQLTFILDDSSCCLNISWPTVQSSKTKICFYGKVIVPCKDKTFRSRQTIRPSKILTGVQDNNISLLFNIFSLDKLFWLRHAEVACIKKYYGKIKL